MFPRVRHFSALTLSACFFFAGSIAWAKVLVIPSVSGEELYTSNSDNAAGEEGSPSADFRTSISPSLLLEGGKKSLPFNGSIGANAKFYKRDPSLNFIAYNGMAGLKKLFTGGSALYLNSGLSYTKTSDSLADSLNQTEEPVTGSVTGLQLQRTGRLTASYSLGGDYPITALSSLAFNIGEDFLFNENSRLFDTRTDSAGVSYSNRLTENLEVSSGYSLSNSSFDAYDYSFDFSGEGGNIATHSVDVGTSWDFYRSDRLSLSGGYFLTDGTETVNGWTASVGFTRTLKLSSYNLGYTRSTTSTFGLSKEINLNESFNAGVGVTLNRMFGVSVDATLSKNRTEPSGNVESRTYAGSLALNYTPTVLSTLSLTLSTYRLESRLDHGARGVKDSYDAGLTLNYQFSRSITLKGGYSHFQERTRNFPDLAYSREVAYIAFDLKPAGGWYD